MKEQMVDKRGDVIEKTQTSQGGPLNGKGPGGRPDTFPDKDPPPPPPTEKK